MFSVFNYVQDVTYAEFYAFLN